MTQSLQLGTIIGSRDLTFTRVNGSVESVKVLTGAPVPDGEDSWLCPYLIQATSFQKLFRMAGVDSMQSLIHTTHIIADELNALTRKHGGTFHYFGDKDLAFPMPDSLGSR
jgi:hypothetical protein